MTFERFMASLYMSAMLQLGMMHEEGGQPRIDLIGARQTIDTLGLLQEKTKGNLTAAEENFLQNCLYELRMAYVEVTNALARPPQTRRLPPTTRFDEGNPHGAGQRHVHGRTDHRLRLRRVPFARSARSPHPPFRAARIRAVRSFSSIPLPIFANRRSANRSARSTPCSTPTATPTTSSASTICVRSAITATARFPFTRAPKPPTTFATCSATFLTRTTSSAASRVWN